MRRNQLTAMMIALICCGASWVDGFSGLGPTRRLSSRSLARTRTPTRTTRGPRMLSIPTPLSSAVAHPFDQRRNLSPAPNMAVTQTPTTDENNSDKNEDFSPRHLGLRSWTRRLILRLRGWRRVLVTVSIACLCLFSSLGGDAGSPPVAHAASTATPTTRTLSTEDRLVDRYVQRYLFRTESEGNDPVASIYRQGYHDATTGTYPQALAEVTASVYGRSATTTGTASSSATTTGAGNVVANVFASALQFLQDRVGLGQTAALAVLAAATVVAGPFAFLVSGMVIGGASKRNMNRVMKKRYGDTYTVDATIKTEPDVEAPEDDDEEDEDDDEEDADDDDE